MVRCIDDHPSAICLCESEINRALFRDYIVRLHCERMVSHGLTWEEATGYLDRKNQDNVQAGWIGTRKLCRGWPSFTPKRMWRSLETKVRIYSEAGG